MVFKLLAWDKSVKDLVRGASVPKDGAQTYQFVGETYYFCSEACRDRFRALPSRYVEAPIKVSESSSGGACC